MDAPSPLPLRDGVAPSRVVLPPGAWPRVLDFLVERYAAIGEAQWRARLARGDVLDARGQRLDAQTPYVAGMAVHYYRELPPEPRVPFEAEVLYRDEHLLIADKPHFLAVIPAGRYLQETLMVRLKKSLGLRDLVPLHRIDRGTAGLVAFSLNPATRAAYQALFPQRAVRKIYEALAPALPQHAFPLVRRSRIVEGEPFFRMREADGEPNSETRIDIAEACGALNLYRLEPVTGRKHQLRVHLAALGAPILNDAFYPDLRPELEDDYARPLQLLARSLSFIDPLSGAPRHFDSRLQLQQAVEAPPAPHPPGAVS